MVLVAGVLLIPVGIATGSESTGLNNASTSAGTAETAQLAVLEALPGTISVTVEGPSVVEPYRSMDIRSRVTGTIIDAAVEGDPLARGEVLARFDNSDQQSGLRQAELNLRQARVDLQRAEITRESAAGNLEDKQSLFTSGTIPRDQLDSAREAAVNAELGVDSARIKVEQSILSLETSRELLASTEIRAPFDGVVLTSNVSAGDIITSGSVLMTFADITRLRLRAEVDEFDIGKVKQGMPVVVTADALGKESIRSTVERVSPAAEVINNISIFHVSTILKGGGEGLRPGMSADLSILVSDDTGLIVPSGAVSTVRGRFYLDVWENEEVLTKRVSAGANDGVNLVITEGLEEGALVVIPQTAGFTLSSGDTAVTGTSFIPVPIPGSGGSR